MTEGHDHAGESTAADGQDWAERAENALSRAGYRRGGARRAMVDLLDGQSCALSAVEIEDRLRSERRTVSRASVYRILEELERLGLIQRVEIGQSLVRYEPVRPGHGHHHHLVCDRCGALTPFSDPELERAIRSLSQRVPLTVSDHEVVLHGACADCES
jgi:Fur family transcriptional regulator, ferric uptake regulator